MDLNTIDSPAIYTDEQVKAGVKELFDTKSFVTGMQAFLPFELSEAFIKNSSSITSSFEFQRDIIHALLHYLKKASMSSLTSSGLEHLDPKEKYLFVSNHRDIGLDSAFINLLLFESKFTTSQIAIGDNLMKHRIAELIFRINKSFIVRRTGKPRELYRSLNALSHYIYKTISMGIDSVWIAQRQGRAKDGNDYTQVSLIKMLGLAKEGSLRDHLKHLNIVPVSISYEYDPCDYLKTKEYIDKKNNPDYQKLFSADMASILQGMKGEKGKVHISFGLPINTQIGELNDEAKAKDMLTDVAGLIDEQILNSYQLNPINYVAVDLLKNDDSFSAFYSSEQKEKYANYFKTILAKINEADVEDAKSYLLGIYANPVLNKSSVGKSSV